MAYVAAGAGVVTEFISSVFFYMYNKTLQQINRFHDRLVASQQVAMSFLAASLVSDQSKKDETKVELSRALLSQAGAKSNDKEAGH
jgi:hypothetical protein